MRRNVLGLVLLCALLQSGFGQEQTFDLGNQSNAQKKNSQPAKKGKKQGWSGQEPSSSQGLGFGTSIEVGRNARAAQDALAKGNYTAAMTYAQRVTQAAPNNPSHWFLLGYAARLAGVYSTSLEAFDHGLAVSPNSVEGLSGKAQTYIRMGKTDEAKKLLLQVIAANPRRGNDLAMAGELFMQSGDLKQATNLLERSENVQPSSHAELLLAIAYMKQKRADQAKALLDRAMRRDPRNVDVFRAVAQYYREARDYKSALAILNKAPRKTVDVYSELGYTYSLAGMKRESANSYEQAASMSPKSINVQLAAAQSQLRVGNLDKTRMYLARGEQLDANYYRLHAIRGDLANVEHRDPDAVREYLQALATMPEGPAEGILYPTQLRIQLIDSYRNLQDEASVQQQVKLGLDALSKFQVDATQQVEYLRQRAALRGIGNDFNGAEADLKQALTIEPDNDSVTLQYANLLWKNNRKPEAQKMYAALLQRDQKNRFALEAMGYLSRDVGDTKAAEGYFTRMANAYPDDYVPFVALGDLYTATREFGKAQTSYEHAFKLAPSNPQIVAAGSNAAIDGHQVDLAGQWIARATGTMKNDPRVMRETERYLFLKGRYLESARIGQEALNKMPHDRDAAVYLAYDYYNLGRFDDTLALVSRYESILPKEPNFPLLAGHVHRQNQLLQQAIDDFTRVVQKDPKMLDALVIRGYVRNDMQDASNAINDFDPALKANPDNAIAHLGRAFSYLQLHRSREALEDIDKAQAKMGDDVGAIHMARATAYRQMRVLDKAEKEYQLALKISPDDLKLHLALADTLYHARHYGRAIEEWNNALQLSPDDPVIYASLAAANAQTRNRAEAYRYIQLAEREGSDEAAILIATGEALLTLGEQKAATDRFARALDAPDANRVDVRLEFAKLFVSQGKYEAAKQEVALAFAEARIGEASPVTTDNLVEAANIFLASHDFDLSERYFTKAKEMGASDDTVAVGLANTYIAQGKDRQAEAILKQLGNSPDYEQNYDYQLAWANIYNQRHDNLHAMTAFAHANQLSSNDPVAERGLLQVAGDQGTEIYPDLFMQNGLFSGALFEDATIYQMDNEFFGIQTFPRSSQETDLISTFRYHPSHFMPINGSFGLRNYRGELSVPSAVAIVNRNTYDTVFDLGTTPVLRWGNAHFILNPGIAFTVRRDTITPVSLNQELFRQYLYLSSSSLFQWITIRGNAVHESGPFSEQNLSSRDLGATVEFEVGRPWGSNSLITGYSVRDLLFHPLQREFFTTATWAGWNHKFGDKASVTGLGKFIRSWRVQDQQFAFAQALIPGGRFDYKFNERWSMNAAADFTRGQGFHAYDNIQSGFLISYVKPLHRGYNDGTGNIPVEYPLRFSFGLQQQSFYNFTGAGATTSSFRPVVQISLF